MQPTFAPTTRLNTLKNMELFRIDDIVITKKTRLVGFIIGKSESAGGSISYLVRAGFSDGTREDAWFPQEDLELAVKRNP